MSKQKPVQPMPKLVWRITPSKPAGEFVLATKLGKTVEPDSELVEPWFHESSMELSKGTEVVETEMDTLPGELVDAFLKPAP